VAGGFLLAPQIDVGHDVLTNMDVSELNIQRIHIRFEDLDLNILRKRVMALLRPLIVRLREGSRVLQNSRVAKSEVRAYLLVERAFFLDLHRRQLVGDQFVRFGLLFWHRDRREALWRQF
jgi:hypothetical protein